MDCVRVLVADDHRAFAEAVALRLAAETGVVVVGTAHTALEVEDQVAALQPDVLVLDVELGQDDGIALARWLRSQHPHTQIVVVTFRDDVDAASAAVRGGVAAFLVKDCTSEELVDAVWRAARGDRWIEPRLLGPVLDDLTENPGARTPEQDMLATLSDREYTVLEHMVEGLDRASIARRMFLSTHTVRTHTRSLMLKLDVHSALEAVALALRAGLRPPAELGDRYRPGRD
jgi:DNA-binding NarL/FixJ family response regulator